MDLMQDTIDKHVAWQKRAEPYLKVYLQGLSWLPQNEKTEILRKDVTQLLAEIGK